MLKIKHDHFAEKYCKFNEQLRSKTIQEMKVEGGKRSLKEYIFQYLEDPENYIKTQPDFLESIIDLLIFLLKRGFFNVQEISELQLAIFNFLKYFMAYQNKPRIQQITDLLIENKLNSKLSMNLETEKSHEMNDVPNV